MEQLSIFSYDKQERNPLFDEIKKDEWITYAKNHQYGGYKDSFLFDYIASYMTSSIEHYDFIKQGYTSKEQILGLINHKIHTIYDTRCLHNSNFDDVVTYSVHNNGIYRLFINYNNKTLIAEVKDPFKEFRLPAMCFEIYDNVTKEYIHGADYRSELLESHFRLKELNITKESIHLVYFKLYDIIQLYKKGATI